MENGNQMKVPEIVHSLQSFSTISVEEFLPQLWHIRVAFNRTTFPAQELLSVDFIRCIAPLLYHEHITIQVCHFFSVLSSPHLRP
jgi:hypothetical protein